MVYRGEELSRYYNKRAQVTIFIILALVIVFGLVSFFLVRENLSLGDVPSELRPVYDYYLSCIDAEAKNGVALLGMQGGRIDVGNYVPGSDYAPFSTHLNFLGQEVPFWYYVSSNGVIKENVPTINEMENELEEFIQEGIDGCDLDVFEERGFIIENSDPDVDVSIESGKIIVSVDSNLAVEKGEVSAIKDKHELEFNSKLRNFYDDAQLVYKKQLESAFLEEYGVDVLRLYAPVDGVEITCSPKTWKTQEIVENVQNGLEGNIGALKLGGNYYDLSDKKREYFVVDQEISSGGNVNFIYSKNWPTKIEIVGDGVDDSLIIAEPVGNQPGMEMMGFCYVPYHYVYDLSFPVMVQFYDSSEMFQFPVVTIIDNNLPREGIYSTLAGEQEEFDLCEFTNQEVSINLYDFNLNSVDANVSYQCFNQRCNLGESKDGYLESSVPSCLNGYLIARADGYEEKRQLFSSNSESSAEVILNREYEMEVNVNVDGSGLNGDAIVTLTRDDGESVSSVLPENDNVKLSEGPYKVKVYVYGNSSITIPESRRTECKDIPKGGLAGIFGGTQEECFEITIPETKIEYALIGGGVVDDFFLESDLKKGKISFNVQGLSMPRSIEDLQNNYAAFENNFVEVVFG